MSTNETPTFLYGEWSRGSNEERSKCNREN
jgi:hypothetical protein